MRKLISELMIASLVLSTPVAAFAQTVNDVSVINSGYNADIDSKVTNTTSITETNVQNATIDQNVQATAISGLNDQNHNIAVGTDAGVSMMTGPATVGVTMTAEANKALNVVELPAGTTATNLVDAVNTGKDLDLDAKTTVNTTVKTTNKQTAYVSQNCGGRDGYGEQGWGRYGSGCDAISGLNDQNHNIGGSVSMTTGPAGVGVDQNTKVNWAENWVGLGGSGNGALNSVSVTNTGANADIDSRVRQNTYISAKNYQYANTYQGVGATAISGLNDQNHNIGGDISTVTGLAGVGVDQNASANWAKNAVSWGVLGGVMPAGMSMVDIINTGADYDSDIKLTENNKVKVKNIANMYGSQYLSAYSVAGKNDQNHNIGGGFLGTNGAGAGGTFSVSGNHAWNLIGGVWDLFDWFFPWV